MGCKIKSPSVSQIHVLSSCYPCMSMTAGSEWRVNKQKMRRWFEDIKVGNKTAEFQQRAGKGSQERWPAMGSELLANMRTWVRIPKAQIESDKSACICNPSASAERWKVETRVFLEAGRPAHPEFATIRNCLKQGPTSEVPSLGSMYVPFHTNTHPHIHNHTHTHDRRRKGSPKMTYESWKFLPSLR